MLRSQLMGLRGGGGVFMNFSATDMHVFMCACVYILLTTFNLCSCKYGKQL